jgi:hypothetical protein
MSSSEPFFERTFLLAASIRAALLVGLGALLGGETGFAIGLVSLPLSLLERAAARSDRTPRKPLVPVVLAWLAALALLAFAREEPIYFAGVRSGGGLAAGFEAVRAEFDAHIVRNPEFAPLIISAYDVLAIGWAGVFAMALLRAKRFERARPEPWRLLGVESIVGLVVLNVLPFAILDIESGPVQAIVFFAIATVYMTVAAISCFVALAVLDAFSRWLGAELARPPA